jgi:hypothetical protein
MGMGDMIWASWDRNCSPARHGKYWIQKETRREHPGLGNYLWMVRARAARRILAAQVPATFPRGNLGNCSDTASDVRPNRKVEQEVRQDCLFDFLPHSSRGYTRVDFLASVR